jgi:hypothetical protein
LCRWSVVTCVAFVGESRSVSYDWVDEQAPNGPGEEKPEGISFTTAYRIIMRATVPDIGTVPLSLRSGCQRTYTSGLQFRVWYIDTI